MRRSKIRIEGREYLHIDSAADLLGCSPQYIRMTCDQNGTSCRIVGGAWYVADEALVAFATAKQSKSAIKSIESRAAHAVRKADGGLSGKRTGRIVGKEIR